MTTGLGSKPSTLGTGSWPPSLSTYWRRRHEDTWSTLPMKWVTYSPLSSPEMRLSREESGRSFGGRLAPQDRAANAVDGWSVDSSVSTAHCFKAWARRRRAKTQMSTPSPMDVRSKGLLTFEPLPEFNRVPLLLTTFVLFSFHLLGILYLVESILQTTRRRSSDIRNFETDNINVNYSILSWFTCNTQYLTSNYFESPEMIKVCSKVFR